MSMRWTQEDLDDFNRRVKNSPPGAAVIMPRGMPPAVLMAAKHPNKFCNVKVTDATGAVHDSKKEYRRWQELQLREIAGEIQHLRRHVPFACVVNGVLICTYEADAVYVEGAATIVEDTKSEATRKLPAYRLKLKLMQALHGIQIREV